MILQTDIDTLVVTFQGWERMWALKDRLVIRRGDITNMEWQQDVHDLDLTLRVAGTAMPGVLLAGTFTGGRTWTFLYVRHPQGWWRAAAGQTLTIDLQGRRYGRIILSADEAQAQAVVHWWRTGEPIAVAQ